MKDLSKETLRAIRYDANSKHIEIPYHTSIMLVTISPSTRNFQAFAYPALMLNNTTSHQAVGITLEGNDGDTVYVYHDPHTGTLLQITEAQARKIGEQQEVMR